MRLLSVEDSEGYFFRSETWVGTLKPYVTENFKQVWKFLFVVKSLPPGQTCTAFLDDVVSVDFFNTHVEIGISYNMQFRLYPSADVTLEDLKSKVAFFQSKGLTSQTYGEVVDFNEGLPPAFDLEQTVSFIELKLNRELLNKGSEKLAEQLHLTPLSIDIRFPPRKFVSERRSKRRRMLQAFNKTEKPALQLSTSVQNLMGARYARGSAEFARALETVRDNAEALIALTRLKNPKFTLGDIFRREDVWYVIIGGGFFQEQMYYDVFTSDATLIRDFEQNIEQNFGETLSEDEHNKVDLSLIAPLSLENAFYAAWNLRSIMRARLFNNGEPVADFPASTAESETEQTRQNLESLNPTDWLFDQRRRASASFRLGDINTNDELFGANQRNLGQKNITEKAREWSKGGNVCTICYGAFEPDDEEDAYAVQLRCGHYFHADCIRNWQKPRYTSNDVNDSFLVPIDTLKCPNCNQPALDSSFGDGIYRYKLRF